MAQIFYLTPEDNDTWTNHGTLGGVATEVGSNLYGTDSNGYPYWGDFTTDDAVCIPRGDGHDNLDTISFEVGVYYSTQQTGNSGGIGKIYDKAYGALALYFDEFDHLTIYRGKDNSTGRYYSCGSCPPGHYYYIQISKTWGSASSDVLPDVWISQDGGTPVHMQTSDFDHDHGSSTGGWYDDAQGPANLGNESSNGDGGCTIPVTGWNFPGALYVFRMHDAIVDFPNDGHFYVDNHLVIDTPTQSYIEYAAFPNTPAVNINNTGEQYVEGQWVSLPGYQATANANRKAILGSYTQWVFNGGATEHITVANPSSSVLDNLDAFTLEFGFYYVGSGDATEGKIFSKSTDDDEFSVFIDDSRGYVEIYRPTDGEESAYYASTAVLTPGAWHDVQITWEMGTGATTAHPYFYIDNVLSIAQQQTQGDGDWSDDSAYSLIIGNREDNTGNFNVSFTTFRLYNYVLDTTTRQANYATDSARWTNTTVFKYSNEAIPITFGESESSAPVLPVNKTSDESVPIEFDEITWLGGGDTQKWLHTNESIDISINELTDLNNMGGDFAPVSPESVNLSIYDTSKITVSSDESIPITFSEAIPNTGSAPYETNCVVKYSTWPVTGTTITNEVSGGAAYNGVANLNRYYLAPTGATSWKGASTSDTITTPKGAAIDNMPQMTMEFCFTRDDLTTAHTPLIYKSAGWNFYIAMTGSIYFYFMANCTGGTKYIVCTSPVLSITGTYYVQFCWDRSSFENKPTITVNGVAGTISNWNTNTGTPVAPYISDAPSNLICTPDNKTGGSPIVYLFKLHNEVLTDAQLTQNYNADKWRVGTLSDAAIAEVATKTSNEAIPITITESNTYKVSNPREYTLEVRKKRITGVAPSPFGGLPNVGWNPFYEPKAIHYEGIFNRTYFGYVKNDGTLAVSQYDHDSKFTDTFILGTPAGDGYVPDDNSGVAITILSDGRIIVVYAQHGRESLFRYRISSTPEDIMSLGGELRVYTSDPCTFIQLVYSHPTLIVLYQFGDQYWGYRINNNNGASDAWESQKTLFDWGGGEVLYIKSSWRWNVANNRIADIAISTHPAHGTEHSIYYCYIRLDGPNYIYVLGSGGVYLRNIGGNAAISPITPAEINAASGSAIYLPKIYDYEAHGEVAPWIWDIYASSNNDIVAVFGIYSWITNHRYGYARYDAELDRWHISEVVPLGAGGSIDGSSEPYYSGGMSIAKREDVSDLVHASVWDSDTEQFEVKDFKSFDLGKTWQWVNRTSGSSNEATQTDAIPHQYSKRVFKTILSEITDSYCQACVDDGVAGLVIWWGHTYSNATDCTAELAPYITLIASYGLKVWLEIEAVMNNHFTTDTTLSEYSSDTTVPGANGVSWEGIISAYNADPRIDGFIFEGSYDVGVQFLRSVTSKPLTQCWIREYGYYNAGAWQNWYEPTHALFNLGDGDARTFRLLNVDELIWEVYTIDQCINAADSLPLFQRDFPNLKIGIIGIVSYTGYWEYWRTYAYIAAHESDDPLPSAVSYETTQALINEYFGAIRDSVIIDLGTIFDDYGYTTPIREQLQNLDSVNFNRLPKNKNIRPVSVINGTDDFSVYWASGAYTHYTNWNLKMECGASYAGYDLLGVIDAPIEPSIQQEIGSADQLTFNLQLTDPKAELFTESPEDIEIWYYGRDSRLKQVFSIQSVTPRRDSSSGNLAGDTLKIIADSPESQLTKFLIQGEYKVTHYMPSYIIEELAEEAIAAGVITEVYVDGDFETPIDIDLSWENLKTAVDKVVEQTGGYARIIVNETNPAQRVLAIMPNFNVFSYVVDPTIIARRTTIIYDVFPEVGLEITNNGGMGGSAYNGKANINRYGELTGGASLWNFSNDTGPPAPAPSTGYYAGWRSSNCDDGYQYQQPPSYWVNVATAIASDFEGYTPGGIWIIGLIQDDNQTCKLQFDGTSDDPYISFTAGTDVNEAYLDAFDAAGVYIWLQVEPADADMIKLIDLVLDQYSEHPCVRGVGIDSEWYRYNTYNDPDEPGKPITDVEAEAWLAEVQLYHSNYGFFLKHWKPAHMPPTQHDGITLISDIAQFGTEGVNTPQEAYDTMMGDFGSWGDTFSDSEVGFQMGYPYDDWWWQDWMPDPIYDFGNDIISWQDNCRDLYWVDFSIMDVYLPDEYR